MLPMIPWSLHTCSRRVHTTAGSGDGGILGHSPERAEQQAARTAAAGAGSCRQWFAIKDVHSDGSIQKESQRAEETTFVRKRGRGMLCPEQLLGPTSPFSSLCATSLGETSLLGPVSASPQQLSSGSLGTRNGYTNTPTAVAVMKAGGWL